MLKKMLFTLTLVIVTQAGMAALVQDLSRGAFVQSLQASHSQPMNVQVISSFKDKIGQRHIRAKQMHGGLPIWNYQVIEHQGTGIKPEARYSGFYVTGLERDLALTAAHLKTEAEVLAFVRRHHEHSGAVPSILQEPILTPYIYLDQGHMAHQVYQVSFAADDPQGNHPSIPTYLVDAQTLEIYHHWDAMMHQTVGTGPGGNLNTGRYIYGQDFDPLDIHIKHKNVCVFKSSTVKTVDLKNKKKAEQGKEGAIPVRYACNSKKSTYFHNEKVVNGAYGVANDAHAFGQAIMNMYKDWYGIRPLPIQLVMQVHYGVEYANAMWDSRLKVMSFGDGDRYNVYPLVALDVAAHEVAHGITQYASDLFYMGHSGGLNESFSDMAAQAAMYYHYGDNNWRIGSTIMKSGHALRYMDDPTKDGKSIAHAADYVKGMDVHYSSGVFNKAFYELATTPGWDTQLAFTVFYYANLTEWQPNETFASAGCGTIRAAKALYVVDAEFDPSAVIAALKSVGIHYNPITAACKT